MQITALAIAEIKKMLALEAELVAQHDYVPAIGWCFNRIGEDSDPGPMLAFFERKKVRLMKPYDTSDILLYDSLPKQLSVLYADCVLDVIDGNFNFVRDGRKAPLPTGPLASRPSA